MLLFSLLSLIGCGPDTLKGQVVDHQGHALANVRITALGSPNCMTTTNTDGRYSLNCLDTSLNSDCDNNTETCPRPTLDFKLQGYFPGLDQPVVGQEAPTTLHAMPTEAGLYLKKGAKHDPMVRGTLTRALEHSDKGGKSRTYCVSRELGTSNRVNGKTMAIFSNQATPWRVFRLDPAGCAYRDARNPQGKWNVEYRDNPAVIVESINDGQDWSEVEVEPGEYFLADWEGFFVPTEAGGDRYSGTWVQVSG
jgi:hypothetical protein